MVELVDKKLEPSSEELISYEDLAILALDSAIASENLLQNLPADTGIINKLFFTLNNAPRLGINAPRLGINKSQQIEHLSPMALAVYTRALRHTTNNQIRTIDDIVKNISDVTHINIDNSTPEILIKVRDFCLALYNELFVETYGVDTNNWEGLEHASTKYR